MSNITVAVAQICSGDVPSDNYAKAEEMIARAAEKDARLVVFPENMNFIGTYDPAVREAVPGGECCTRLSAAAKRHGIWVHIGSIKEISDDPYKAYNTSVLYSPQRELVAKYRKLHLCDMEARVGKKSRESDRVIFGEEIVVADTELGKIGMAICYDMRFPELYRLMADKGAQIICHPACFNGRTGAAHWEILLRSIALHNSCYVLAANQCGAKPTNGKPDWGHSCIIDPWGTVIADMGYEKEGVAVADIDLDYATQLKGRQGSLNNRRKDMYTLLEK